MFMIFLDLQRSRKRLPVESCRRQHYSVLYCRRWQCRAVGTCVCPRSTRLRPSMATITHPSSRLRQTIDHVWLEWQAGQGFRLQPRFPREGDYCGLLQPQRPERRRGLLGQGAHLRLDTTKKCLGRDQCARLAQLLYCYGALLETRWFKIGGRRTVRRRRTIWNYSEVTKIWDRWIFCFNSS